MKIDITSMFFNSKIEGQTATPAWGTSIGQNKSRGCRIDDFRKEVVDMVIGMTYMSVSDLSKLDNSKGSSEREIITCAVFKNVYINGKKLDNTQYTLLLVREHSKSHEGRLIVCYAPYIKYDGYSNQECINLMQQNLGCTPNGCWFVYDIEIVNQSEIHFNAIVVNPNEPVVYSTSVKSRNRSEEWKSLIPEDKRDGWYDKITDIEPRQIIYYGAPGTGKSFEINRLTKGKEVIRTTFHPDSDYSTFVGAYKPTSIEIPVRDVTGKVIIEGGKQVTENRIVYEFVEQAFLQAYTNAWNAYATAAEGEHPKEQYLVIEEINRGNCAQIFGDLFQLLDRNRYGFSDYPITADKDMKKQLAKAFKDLTIADADRINKIYKKDIVSQVLNGEVLLLPDNLYIWATMNTSDQSLFPIDSAFKRRWDWKYMPICEGKENGVSLGWQIKTNGKTYDWWQFVEKINAEIDEQTKSEDKKLGYFFCKADNSIIDAETFVGKVVFYLWNDVFKDQAFASDIFQDGDEELTFSKFYDVDANGKAVVREDKVELFLQNLGVDCVSQNSESEVIEIEEIENSNATTISKTTLKEIEFPDGTVIDSASGVFDAYMHAIEKIGIAKVCSISDKLKYRRRGRPLISKEKYEELESDYGYSYIMMGDYYFLRGANTYTYVRILEDLNELLQIGLTIRN